MSTYQIIKHPIPKEILFELLDRICFKNDTYYVFNYESYKRGIYTTLIPDFLAFIRSNYFLSKRSFVDRATEYPSFVTVLRQICRHLQLDIQREVKYDRSVYDIVSFIYHEQPATSLVSSSTDSSVPNPP